MIAPIIGLTGVAIGTVSILILIGYSLMNSDGPVVVRLCFGGIALGLFMYGVARAIDFARGIK